jgi:uncharacterized protein YdaU (DUF1376 family)
MSAYNAKKARTKYACPIWVDAFLRDTLELEADEIGAYHLILYAMWTREACDFPDDDRKLARISRCSMRLWKARIRPALEVFFKVENGAWISRRLRKEASKTEAFLQSQSDRKISPDKKRSTYALPEGTHEHSLEIDENSDNTLKTNDPPSTGDDTGDTSGRQPTQETKKPSIGGGDDARAKIEDPPPVEALTFREQILGLAGADVRSGITGPNGGTIGTPADMLEAQRWESDLGLSKRDILIVVREVMARKRDGPPSKFTYFTPAMQRFAGEKSKPALKVISPQPGDQNHGNQNRHSQRADLRENRSDPALEQIARLAGLGAPSGNDRS